MDGRWSAGIGTNQATWTNLFSSPPPCGTEFMIFDPIGRQFATYAYADRASNADADPGTALGRVGLC